MEEKQIVSQSGRERLTTTIERETALLLVWHAKARGVSQGELIDLLAKQNLPAVTVADTAPAE
jgi:hypothetical protein